MDSQNTQNLQNTTAANPLNLQSSQSTPKDATVISKFVDEVNQYLTSSKALLEDANVDSINVKAFEARENLILQLSNLLNALPELTTRVETALVRAKTTHAREVSAVDSLLNKLKKKDDAGDDDLAWTMVVRRKPEARTAPAPASSRTSGKTYAVAASPSAPTLTTQNALTVTTANNANNVNNVNPNASRYSKVKFTEALAISAIRVPTFDYVKQDGDLYYVETADHFAFRLGGQLFHGNIGVIYTEEKNPEKIKDCKFAASCMKQDNCDYYHDPVKFPGSKDHRNFIASSWLYAPPNSQYKNRPRSRRFGSREHLDTDIVGLQPEEVSRFNDQTVHDLLCSLLLNQAYTAQ